MHKSHHGCCIPHSLVHEHKGCHMWAACVKRCFQCPSYISSQLMQAHSCLREACLGAHVKSKAGLLHIRTNECTCECMCACIDASAQLLQRRLLGCTFGGQGWTPVRVWGGGCVRSFKCVHLHLTAQNNRHQSII